MTTSSMVSSNDGLNDNEQKGGEGSGIPSGGGTASMSESGRTATTATTSTLDDAESNATPPLRSHYDPNQDSIRYRNLLDSIDRSLDATVAPIHLANFRKFFPDLGRDRADELERVCQDVALFVQERSKEGILRTLDEFQVRAKLNRLQHMIQEALDQHSAYPEELEDMRANPRQTEVAIRAQVMSDALMDLQQTRDDLEKKLAVEKVQYRERVAHLKHQLKVKEELQARIQQQLAPFLELDATAMDEEMGM